jgi:hypothetical protein
LPFSLALAAGTVRGNVNASDRVDIRSEGSLLLSELASQAQRISEERSNESLQDGTHPNINCTSVPWSPQTLFGESDLITIALNVY